MTRTWGVNERNIESNVESTYVCRLLCYNASWLRSYVVMQHALVHTTVSYALYTFFFPPLRSITDERQNAGMGLIHADYRVQRCRLLYSDSAFLVMPPASDMFLADLTLLTPAPDDNQVGRQNKGPGVHTQANPVEWRV